MINTLRPEQKFVDDIFKCTFLIFYRMSLKFVLKGPIYNKPALVQVMAWQQACDKSLAEPMIISFTYT